MSEFNLLNILREKVECEIYTWCCRMCVLPASNHVHNHVMEKQSKSKTSDSTPYNGKRRRSHEEKEDDVLDEEDGGDWTKHVSGSSGRTYYYNKKLDKSQWEAPKTFAKKCVSPSHVGTLSNPR